MSNRYVFWTVVVLLCIGAFVAALFVVQNSTRTTQLSLNLGFAAWELARPVNLPVLMGICIGAGWLTGLGTWAVFAARSARRRVDARSDQHDDGWR